MKVVIIGSGYVGLVTGGCFADMGVDVCCVDIDKAKVERLSKGIVPIYEPELQSIVERNLHAGRLSFACSAEECMEGVDAVFIAVGTPPGEDGSADVSYVLEAARSIGRSLTGYAVVTVKSTVPVGTTAKVKAVIAEQLRERGVDIEFDVASNPEFLKEGRAVRDFMMPDRVVVGVESERARALMRTLYSPLMMTDRLLFTDVVTAEMTKYAANAMLATRISFMNDIANLCELTGADVNMVRKGTAPGYYSTLAHRGFFPVEDLKTLRSVGSYLQGHPDMKNIPGVDMSSGSLGQGISAAVGMAASAKIFGDDFRVYTLLGDGEIQEGQVWEAAMDRKSTRLNSSHLRASRMPSSA